MTKQSDKLKNTEDPNTVCQFSYKAAYLKLGRLCQLSHPIGQSCFTWNTPEIFRQCPARIVHFSEQIEKDVLESL